MNITEYYKTFDSESTYNDKNNIINIIEINDIIQKYYSQYNDYRKEKNNIESVIDMLHDYPDDDIVDVLSHLMKLNDDIKNISYQIYNLVTKRNNIINKTNKIVSKKKPTSGESSIIKILNDLLSQNKIFYYEWDKVLPIKFKNNLRADLFIIDNKLNKYIIEYDGIQHNQYIPFFHTNNNFDISKHRDKLKNQYCKKNNIKILHIPYTSSNIDIYSSVYSFIKPT